MVRSLAPRPVQDLMPVFLPVIGIALQGMHPRKILKYRVSEIAFYAFREH